MVRENRGIVYICNQDPRKMKICGEFCQEDCRHTFDPDYAKYGAIAGKPEWYPDRFYYDDRGGAWVEKERY